MRRAVLALSALAAIVAAVVSCGDGEPARPVSLPAHPPAPVNGSPPYGPPTVHGFLVDSTVAVRGRAVTPQQFHVSEVIVGEFEDGGSASRAVSLRMPDPVGDIEYVDLDQDVEYLLFLHPGGADGYQVTVHYPWGSYKRGYQGERLAPRVAGIFKVTATGALTYAGRRSGQHRLAGARASIAAIKATVETRPGLVGCRLRTGSIEGCPKRAP